jgi:hypothetical protein
MSYGTPCFNQYLPNKCYPNRSNERHIKSAEEKNIILNNSSSKKPLILPEEIEIDGKILVLSKESLYIYPDQEGLFILDFSRDFEDPDLSKTPALAISVNSSEEKYLIKKYNLVLGEFSDLCLA